ncbi:hypothetical protein E0W29_10745 [Neisseria meningitidis]|nr:hypothetical protein [Neisseria meningitidis]
MFGNHGLGGLLEEGAHEKSPKCLGGNLGDFGEFCKGLGLMIKPYPAYSAAHIWHDSIHFPMRGKGVNLYELSLSGLDTERIPFLWANPHPTALKSEFQPI